MARHVLIGLLLTFALGTFGLGASGCLRVEFDLCDDDDPPPDCALIDGAIPDAGADGQPHDAGPDAGLDAGT